LGENMRAIKPIFSIPALFVTTALAQSPGTFTTGQVLTAPELNSAFAGKQDYPPPASLPLAGGTMTGPLTLNADPAAALGAATKQYVDAHVGAPVPMACGGAAGSILSLDAAGANCVAATGLTSTASGPNVAGGYYYQYNGVNALWAQTALNSYYIGQGGNPANTGTQLTGIGYQTLLANTTGSGNLAVGSGALIANTTGSFNSAAGLSALGLNTNASNNTAMGANALGQNGLAANDNSAAGYDSLYSNQTGTQNTALGSNSLLNLGSQITATAMVNANPYTILTQGTTNFVTLGAANNTPGTSFTAAFPATTITSGTYTSGTGAVSLTLAANIGLATGSPMTVYGATGTGTNIASVNVNNATAGAGTGGTTLNYTIATGLTITTITGGQVWLTGFGTGTLTPNSARNIAIGYQAGTRMIDSSGNTHIGGDPGTTWPNNTSKRVWIGDGFGTPYLHNYGAYQFNGSTSHNIFLGEAAGNYTMTAAATDNMSAGYRTLSSLTSGGFNVAIGSSALTALTTGTGNIAIGLNSMSTTTTSLNNVAIGNNTLQNNATGNGTNVAIGLTAGLNVSTGSNNTFVGANSGRGITTGTNNSALGQYIYGANASNTIVLAAGATNEMDYGLTTPALWTSAAGMAAPQLIATGGPPTLAGTCAVTAAGGKTAGTLTVPAGGCTIGQTIIITPGITAPAGWACIAANETGSTRTVSQTAHSTTTATMSATAALTAADVISYNCRGY
jgi:hypothetical protein